MPTYREIAERFNWNSPKAAVDHVRGLVKAGYVRVAPGKARGIELLRAPASNDGAIVSVPLLGLVPAGAATDHEELRERTIAVDQFSVGGRSVSRLFAVRVYGDSMTGLGILDGDTVVAERDAEPSEGEVVVALIDGGSTVKTLRRQKGRFYLKAENPAYPDLVPTSEMSIQGVVRTLIRKVC